MVWFSEVPHSSIIKFHFYFESWDDNEIKGYSLLLYTFISYKLTYAIKKIIEKDG